MCRNIGRTNISTSQCSDKMLDLSEDRHVEPMRCRNIATLPPPTTSSTPVVLAPIITKVRRSMIFADLVDAFKEKGVSILNESVSFSVVDLAGKEEMAEDFGGVFWDVLSAFWDEFSNGYAAGEETVVPILRHDVNSEDWKAIATILVKGYKECMFLPINLNIVFLTVSCFGEEALDKTDLISGFMEYLPSDEAKMYQRFMCRDENDEIHYEDDETDSLLESLSSLCKSTPKTCMEITKILEELAHCSRA